MSARAVWKGVLQFDKLPVPVKFYSALSSQKVSFRLLNRKDNRPVRQVLVNQQNNNVVEYGDAGRGYRSGDRVVLLSDEELEGIRPEPSRDIELLQFVPQAAIDYRWFDRPYYLGPDGDEDSWSALAAALAASGLTGVARWVMRNKEYYGALLLQRGYPMLHTLHTVDEVLPLDADDLRDDSELEPRQVKMARQLIGMLEADFEPDSLTDDYRDKVLALIEAKRKGETVKPSKAPETPRTTDLTAALEASLEGRAASA